MGCGEGSVVKSANTLAEDQTVVLITHTGLTGVIALSTRNLLLDSTDCTHVCLEHPRASPRAHICTKLKGSKNKPLNKQK